MRILLLIFVDDQVAESNSANDPVPVAKPEWIFEQ